jgi:intracellular sulfur oxidation DsrE/DsrF family protein
MKKLLNNLLLLASLAISQAATATDYSHPTINRLLAADETPDGVVFELIAWDDNTWMWAAPMITDLRRQLLAKFPGVDIAVVSHGGEQFQLTRERIGEQAPALAQLETLTGQGVELHVCGAHSLMSDVPISAYIDIVDVSPSGPAQINDYIKLGYRHILLSRPPD